MPSFLAKAIKRNSLLDKIDIHLARTALQEQQSRATHLIDPIGFHPSQIGACLRSVFYSWCGVPMDSNPPKPKTMRIFHNGDYFHERMQKYFRDMGILEGQWKCRACQKNWKGLAGSCPHCNAPVKAQKYDEIDFKKGWMIGASDGIVYLEPARRVIIELKSMNSRDFTMLKKPLDKHKEQGNCYMYALDVDECAFIYENKDTQEIKIFLEKRDPKLVNKILNRIIDFVDNYWKKSVLPDRECENANWCAYQKECYITKRTAKALLEQRSILVREKQNANKNGTQASNHSPKDDGKTVITLCRSVKGTSGNVDKKPLLTHSAKAHLRKHGGVLSK